MSGQTTRIAIALTLLLIARASAQDQPAPLAFDVVSVKIDREGTGGAGDSFPKHGTWHWTRIPLSFLVMMAYDVSLNRVTNIPSSFQGPEIAFDITAKMPVDVTDDQFHRMLQSLLADRFKLQIHREMRESSVNTIEVAKGGPKLQPATAPCAHVQKSTPVPEGEYRCGEVTLSYPFTDGVRHQRYYGRLATVADLAAAMSSNGPVLDETGIQGLWDIEINIEVNIQPRSDDPDERTSREFAYQHAVSTAFEKQLGLLYDPGKLKKRPVPVIVVDHVELPTAN